MDTNWNKNDVIDALPKIRRLKGIARAQVEGNYLKLVTSKGLKHKGAHLPLEQIEMNVGIIEDSSYSEGFRYLHPKKWFLRKHPVVQISEGYYFDTFCMGENEPDYRTARLQGPLMTVIQLLAMLQTIQKDSRDPRTRNRRLKIPGFFIVIMGVYVGIFVSLLITFHS